MRDIRTPLERIAAALECIAGRYTEERERLLHAVAVELNSALRHIDDEPQRAGSKIACALSNLEQFAGRELGAQERAGSEDALIGHIDPMLWGPPCDVCKHRRLVHYGQCCVSGCECAVPARLGRAHPVRQVFVPHLSESHMRVNQLTSELARHAAKLMPAKSGYAYVIAVMKIDGSEPIATAGNCEESAQAAIFRGVANSFEYGTDTFQGYVSVKPSDDDA